MSRKKVFCVGLNKTGTTTFGDALSELGYKTWTWSSHSADFTLNWHEGRFTSAMRAAVDNHDAFEDLPWGLCYRELNELFPDSLFVLTERLTPTVWLNSIQRHISRSEPWVGHYLVYGSYDPYLDYELYLNKYFQHSMSVRAYFRDYPQKLLTVCWESVDGWDKLAQFLNVDAPKTPFPHSNKTVKSNRETGAKSGC